MIRTTAIRLAALTIVISTLGIAQAAVPPPSGGGSAGTGDPVDFIVMVVYAAVALTFSSLCSVAEAVLLSVTPSYVANLENKGKPSAKLLGYVKRNIDQSLAAILTLNTIAHTVGAGGAGAKAGKYYGDDKVGIAMVVLTLLILFVSEIIPKTLGAVYWRSLAPLTARFVRALNWLLFPLLWFSEKLTSLFTGGHSHHSFSRAEFAALADIGEQGGHLDAKESRILKNLLRFPELAAGDIMTPSTVVFALQQDRSAKDVLQEHPDIHFSRLPIFGENRDDVTGFVLTSELLSDNNRNEGRATLKEMKRDMRAVQDTTRLSNVLEELLDNRAHILLVVDKYGGMEGIVTLEDVVETLIGIEIVDEVDKIDDMRKLARQKWEKRMDRLGIDVRDPEQGELDPKP